MIPLNRRAWLRRQTVGGDYLAAGSAVFGRAFSKQTVGARISAAAFAIGVFTVGVKLVSLGCGCARRAKMADDSGPVT